MVGDKTVCGVVLVDRYATAAGRRGGQAELVRGRRRRRIQHVLLLHVEHLLLLPLLLSCELLLLHYFLVFPQLQYLKLKLFSSVRLHTYTCQLSLGLRPGNLLVFIGGKSYRAML